jgi:hypothetical protein
MNRVGWGNVALFAVVIACLSVAGLAMYEVSCSGEPPGAGAP